MIDLNLFKSVVGENDCLLLDLSDKHMEALKNGSGEPLDQIRWKHSSAGLTVNYFLLLEKTLNTKDLQFEWKETRPLKYGGLVNIDACYTKDNTVYFVESKFLEPYYSGNEEVNSSYQERDKYKKCTKDVDKWMELFDAVNSYEILDTVQLCRHLLAISSIVTKSAYKGKNIVLQSYTWIMPDCFISLLPPDKQTECTQIREKLKEEEVIFKNQIEKFINEVLSGYNISFEIKHYNDSEVLSAINNDSQFMQRYYLD